MQPTDDQIKAIENWTYEFTHSKAPNGRWYARILYTNTNMRPEYTIHHAYYSDMIKDAHRMVRSNVWGMVNQVELARCQRPTKQGYL